MRGIDAAGRQRPDSARLRDHGGAALQNMAYLRPTIGMRLDFAIEIFSYFVSPSILLYNRRLWRGVRVVNGAALEKRSRCFSERGFESRPLRRIIYLQKYCYNLALDESLILWYITQIALLQRTYSTYTIAENTMSSFSC
jgi:hypothetical protein